MNTQKNFKEEVKSVFLRHRIPPKVAWKDVFRKRCMERLKSSREKVISDLRNAGDKHTARDIVMSELGNIVQEHGSLTPANSCNNLDSLCEPEPLSDLDELLHVLETVRAELEHQESVWLDDYEADIKHQEEALCSAIRCLEVTQVICPTCQKSSLEHYSSMIYCSCGFSIRTREMVTLEQLQQLLTQAVIEHDSVCPWPPSFIVRDPVSDTNALLLHCQKCGACRKVL